MDGRAKLCHNRFSMRVGVSDSLCGMVLEGGKATRNRQRVRRLTYRENPAGLRGPVTDLRTRLTWMIGHS